MKISLNWMKSYGGKGLDISIDTLVARIGSQIGAVEEIENIGQKYYGVIVAKVVECYRHPDSDHLNVCKIDDGGKAQGVERDENGHVQVVCGAPNVHEGLFVAWLPPGSTVPESVGKDPLVLGSRELRGVMSNGMLASPRELALGDSHEGILEIDEPTQPGDDFAPLYGLDDYVIDIENKMFTHRPDCFGQLGVAREIAGVANAQFTSPDWYLHQLPVVPAESSELPFTLHNEIPELVPRFITIRLANVTVKPSPMWLQTYLARVGMKSINNVVDVTNYMMLLTAQPMHAYDYDKLVDLSGDTSITIRHPRPGEKVRLLNGKEIQPRDEAIMIASADKLLAVGGIMGGSETEVDENTRNIVLEVATFDMYSIRRTSMAHGLFTDAATRTNKGQSPLQNDVTARKAADMLTEITGATICGMNDDNHVEGRAWVHPPVPITLDFINARLGLSLDASYVRALLEHVEFTIEQNGEENLVITAPFWRTDIETREDVVEEVGRLHGFDKLPLELPKRSIRPVAKDDMLELKRNIRTTLASFGANETLNYSFVHGDLLRKVGQNPDDAFRVSNALSPDLQYFRLSLTPSLLEKVHPNIKAGYDRFALFEIGKAHAVQPNSTDNTSELPPEYERLAVVVSKKDSRTVSQSSAFYAAKRYAAALLDDLGLGEIVTFSSYEPDTYVGITRQKTTMYETGRTAVITIGDQCIGEVGEYSVKTRKALKLPEYTAGFELDTSLLLEYFNEQKKYVPIPRFPKVTQDLTLEVASSVTYADVYKICETVLGAALPDQTVAELLPRDIYQAQGTDVKRLTFRVEVASYERTLTDSEVAKLMDAMADAAANQISARKI